MANIYQLRLGFVSSGKNFWEVIWHYQLSEAGTGTFIDYCEGLINQWQTNNLAGLMALLSPDTFLNIIDARRITGGGSPTISEGINQPGTETNDTYSTTVAADIAWLPGGIANRVGHTYLAGIPFDRILSDALTGPWVTNAVSWANTQLAQMTLPAGLGTAKMGTYSRKTSGFNPTTAFVIKPKLTALNKRSLPVT